MSLDGEHGRLLDQIDVCHGRIDGVVVVGHDETLLAGNNGRSQRTLRAVALLQVVDQRPLLPPQSIVARRPQAHQAAIARILALATTTTTTTAEQVKFTHVIVHCL